MDYKAKAKDLTNRLAITGTQEDYDNVIEAALRESAADAYAEMAARMWELNRLASPADHIALTESRATEMSIYAGESAYYRTKAAALRAPEVKTGEPPPAALGGLPDEH